MVAKYAGLVHGQRAAKAAQRQLHEARTMIDVALWNLRYNDDPLLGSPEVRAAWRDFCRRVNRVLGPDPNS